jgi:hypothetical protein
MSLQYDEQVLCLATGLLRGVLDDDRRRQEGYPGPLVWAVAMQHVVNVVIADLLLRDALCEPIDDLPWIIIGEPTDMNRDCRVTLTYLGTAS